MRRRDFIALSGAVSMAWPRPANAQQTAGVRKIGVLDPNRNDTGEQARLTAFRQGLASLGWTEGQNVRFEIRFANSDLERLPSLAADLVNAAPDVIFAVNSPSVLALRTRTHSIPIVFMSASDPVRLGLVASLARPGGNITGFSNFDFAMGSKWLQLLEEISPHITRVAIPYDPKIPSYRGFVPSIESAAKSAGIEAIALPIRSVDELHRVADLIGKPGTGLIALPSNATGDYNDEIIGLAARRRLPAIYWSRTLTLAGGLMSYTADAVADARRAASYVDRILRGTKPADLPVQNPTKYRLSINVKTAKAIGLTVPQSLLVQADEVIR